MKKQSPKSESTQKSEQDSPVRKILTFGQRLMQKVKVIKSQSQLVHGQSQWIHGLGRFRIFRSGHGSGNRLLMSSYDMLLTWIRADVDVLAWVLTWSDDVIR